MAHASGEASVVPFEPTTLVNVITVYVPPLRERAEDIPLLADHFLRRYAEKNNKPMAGFTHAAMERLSGYHWPGNVRELENVVERAVVLTKNQTIDEEDLPRDLFASLEGGDGRSISVAVGTPLEEVERRLIHETLKRTKGDKRLAAQLLGIATRTIYRRLETWGAGSEEPERTAEGGSDPTPEAPTRSEP